MSEELLGRLRGLLGDSDLAAKVHGLLGGAGRLDLGALGGLLGGAGTGGLFGGKK